MKRIVIFTICLFFAVYPSFATGKERLVLMPLHGKDIDPALKPMMQSAVAEGLSKKYEVLYGKRVEEKVREIYQKVSEQTPAGEECDSTKCLQEVGMEFQAELIATVKVLKRQSGYLLALNILNAYEDRLIYSKSEPCKGCDEFQIIDVLKVMGGGKPSATATAPAPEKVAPPPKKEEKRSSDGRYIDHENGTITDTTTNLMWTKKDSWSDTGGCRSWNASKTYVSGLSTGGHSDWRMPTIQELQGIYEKSKKNTSGWKGKAVDLDPIFSKGGAASYWSSETAGPGSCCALFVFFYFEGVEKSERDFCYDLGVRAVRP